MYIYILRPRESPNSRVRGRTLVLRRHRARWQARAREARVFSCARFRRRLGCVFGRDFACDFVCDFVRRGGQNVHTPCRAGGGKEGGGGRTSAGSTPHFEGVQPFSRLAPSAVLAPGRVTRMQTPFCGLCGGGFGYPVSVREASPILRAFPPFRSWPLLPFWRWGV